VLLRSLAWAVRRCEVPVPEGPCLPAGTRGPPTAGLCPYAATRLRLAGQLPGRWRKSGQGCRG
jgi:hypothetical protein